MPEHRCGNTAMCERMQDVIDHLDGRKLDCDTLRQRLGWFRMTYSHNPKSQETIQILTQDLANCNN